MTQDKHQMQSCWHGCHETGSTVVYKYGQILVLDVCAPKPVLFPLSHYFILFYFLFYLSVALSRLSPTPKTPWAWAAPSLRVALVSSAACPHVTCRCTSTTPRSLTRGATSVRSSFLEILASLLSSVWTWRVRNRFSGRHIYFFLPDLQLLQYVAIDSTK